MTHFYDGVDESGEPLLHIAIVCDPNSIVHRPATQADKSFYSAAWYKFLGPVGVDEAPEEEAPAELEVPVEPAEDSVAEAPTKEDVPKAAPPEKVEPEAKADKKPEQPEPPTGAA